MSDEVDRAHVPNYVAPEAPRDDTPPGVLDHSYIKSLYVSPVPDAEDEPEPDPEQVRKEAYAKELRAHAELVQRMQEEDRKRAAKSVEPTSIEGQD